MQETARCSLLPYQKQNIFLKQSIIILVPLFQPRAGIAPWLPVQYARKHQAGRTDLQLLRRERKGLADHWGYPIAQMVEAIPANHLGRTLKIIWRNAGMSATFLLQKLCRDWHQANDHL